MSRWTRIAMRLWHIFQHGNNRGACVYADDWSKYLGTRRTGMRTPMMRMPMQN
jgi:hypothetical protein